MFDTTDLIPTNGVYVTETHHPKGFTVGSYDAEGFISAEARWFPTREQAEAHARKLAGAPMTTLTPLGLQKMIAAAVGEAHRAATALVVAQSWVGQSCVEDDRDPVAMLNKQVDDALTHAMAALDQIRDLRTICAELKTEE